MKPKVAYFSPLPPIRSGIADYSAALIPYLKRYVDLTIFTDQEGALQGVDVVQKPLWMIEKEWWRYDLLLYHIGNSVHHDKIYEMATRFGGVVVLHDYVLHHFLTERADQNDRPSTYTREMAYEHGREGVANVWQTRAARGEIDRFANPLNRRLIDTSVGMVVHSEYVRQQLLTVRPDLPVKTVPMLDLVGERDVRPFSKTSKGFSADTILFASAGQITKNKQIEFILQAMAKLRDEMRFVHYLIIGEAVADIRLDEKIESLGLANMVTQTGFVEDYETFLRWVKMADVLINLRYPTLGETSSVVLQGMALERPVVVFDHGWYRELAPNSCVKVPVMDEFALYEYLQALAVDGTTRQALGQRASDMIWRDHQPDAVARQYGRLAAEFKRETGSIRLNVAA